MVTIRQPVRGASRLALARFAGRVRRRLALRDLQVLVTGNREMRALNRRFRGQDKPTDVLSFPAAVPPQGRAAAGDIAVSAPIAARNARRYGHSSAEEVKILILHGALHLAGYDHERDNGRMARVEARLRRELRLPASLIARSRDGSRP